MKKRKNILKEAGVLLIAMVMILSSTAVIAIAEIHQTTTSNNNIQKTTRVVFLDEDFTTWLPDGWSTDDFTQSFTNYAGGTSPEAQQYWLDIVGDNSYLNSKPVDTASASALSLEFKSYIDDYTGGYSCYVWIRSDPSDPWTDVTPWSNPITSDIPAGTYSIDITDDIGSGTQVMFEFDGPANNIDRWCIDDVKISDAEYIPRTTGYENWYTYVGDGSVDVNIANGNLIFTRTDLEIDARIDLPYFVRCRTCGISIERTYNSQSVEDSPFGIGWTHNYNVHLQEAPDETITLYDGDGSLHDFIKSGDTYISPPGIHSTLIKNDDDTFTLRHKHGTVSNFDMNGKLTTVVDTNENQLTMTYDGQDRLISVVGCCGSYINLECDSYDRVTKITDSANREVTYEYNVAGYLSKATDPLGHSTDYIYDGNNILESITNPNGKKTIFTYQYLDELYRVHEISYEAPAITAYTFNYDFSSRIITSVTDANGHTTAYEYDDCDRVTQIIDPLGKMEIYLWDADNNVIMFADKDANTWAWDYDEWGNPLQIEDPLGYVSTFTYEDVFNKITSWTDENGHTTSFEYDTYGNLIKTIDRLGYFETYEYDSRGNVIAFTDKNDHTTFYEYDDYGHVTKKTDPLAFETGYEYDSVGNLIKEVDANGHETEYEYDKLGRLTKKTDPQKKKTEYEYDPVGNLIKEVDAESNVVEYEYDKLGRLTKITRPFETDKSNSVDRGLSRTSQFFANFLEKHPLLNALLEHLFVDFLERHPLLKDLFTKDDAPRPRGTDYAITEFEYDPVGNMISVTDPNGFRTNYVYNDRNERIKKINPEEETTLYIYDNVGNQKTIKEPNGNVISYAYDARNQLTDVSDSIGIVIKYSYDPVGNRLTDTDANGNTITYDYDEMDRLVSTFDPMGEEADYEYDAVGNLLSASDRNDNPTSYDYDEVNRLTKVIDALGYETNYEYDPVGNLIDINDANDHATSYTYDQLNRVIRETFADGTTREFTYDAVDNIISREDQLGQVTQYEYDDLYRLKKRNYPGSNDDSFTYDKAGRVLKASNSDSTVTFEYDNANRVIQTKQDNYLIEYDYDIPNNRRTIKYPVYKKSHSKNQMFTLGSLDDGSVVEKWDKRGRLIDVEKTVEGVIAHYVYDDADRLLTKTYLNDVVSSYSYNDNNWVTSLQHNKYSTLIAGFNYDYDYEGNSKYSENLLTFDPSKEHTHSERYIYDDVYRLVNFKTGELVTGEIPYPIKTHSWTLDPVGNWNQFTIDGDSYQNTPNQMNEYDDPSTNGPPPVPDDDGIPDDFKDPVDTPGADGSNFAHDKNGNLVDDGVNTYEYDYENRLIRAVRKSDSAVLDEYRYDAFGRRIEKEVSGVTTEFVYDGWRVIEERVDKEIESGYFYGGWIDEVLCMQRDGQTYYYHANKLGSIVALTDASGDVVERYAYDVYGAVSIMDEAGTPLSNSAVDNPYMFTGRRLDPETGLYYYRARMYNPETGRFMSKDPLGMVDGPNMYSYVSNNPTTFIDPYGYKMKIYKSVTRGPGGTTRDFDVYCITEIGGDVFWRYLGNYDTRGEARDAGRSGCSPYIIIESYVPFFEDFSDSRSSILIESTAPPSGRGDPGNYYTEGRSTPGGSGGDVFITRGDVTPIMTFVCECLNGNIRYGSTVKNACNDCDTEPGGGGGINMPDAISSPST
ncbi:MAG: hypothetical protein KAW45_06410 [Thermoplasmatales archaeon]|nr:hypothetical protein [Thermoplasmatales archaeon]